MTSLNKLGNSADHDSCKVFT